MKALEDVHFQASAPRTPEPSDFRLLTATNLPLSELSKRLDADFFDRIGASSCGSLSPRAPRETWARCGTTCSSRQRAAGVGRSPALGQALQKERVRLVAALQAHPLPGNCGICSASHGVTWRPRADDAAPLPPSEAVEYALRRTPQTVP